MFLRPCIDEGSGVSGRGDRAPESYPDACPWLMRFDLKHKDDVAFGKSNGPRERNSFDLQPIMSVRAEPLSIESLLQKQKAEKEAASKVIGTPFPTII